ncbi:MAG: endonuclease/exonuclease/phosphatase family protein, partial [Chloroflexales bacterium]|nr:endonuclease/exonuclease/phosphatase family protein [Chloroflexales bacterium]
VLRRALALSALIYGAAQALLALCWLMGLRLPGRLALASDFAVWCNAPLVFLLPLALVSRSPQVMRSVAVPSAIFVLAFGPALLPRSASDDAGVRLRVATWNVQIDNTQPDAVLATLRALGADVVLLQEVSPQLARSIANDAVLQKRYHYQLMRPLQRGVLGESGQGLLSRFALTANPPPELAHNELQSYPGMHVRLLVAGREVTLINIHPLAPEVELRRVGRVWLPASYSSAHRGEQQRAIERTLRLVRGPLILGGDFNTADRDPWLRRLAHLHDAFGERGWGFGLTFPTADNNGSQRAPFPLVRIDYLFSSDELRPQGAWVACAVPSDHCLVGAELAMGW